jgi:hypothetical protein
MIIAITVGAVILIGIGAFALGSVILNLLDGDVNGKREDSKEA